MRLLIDGKSREFNPEALVVIGYAGRDRAAVEAHIDELAELGVPRPPTIPFHMVFPPWLISQSDRVVVSGSETSGEAEVVLVVDGNDTFVTVGSDHTDRVLESVDIVASKGVCHKPVASSGWSLSDVSDNWDSPSLRSWIDNNVAYQDGPVSANIAPSELVSAISWHQRPHCFVAFTGTVPVIGDIRPSKSFRAELSAPGLRAITLTYETDVVPGLAD